MRWLRANLRLFATVMAGLLSASSCFAGWVSTQNDTKLTLVVQEICPGPLPKRGKLARLLPGEHAREYMATPCEKRIQIWDPRQPTILLFDGKLACPPGDVLFKILSDPKTGKLQVLPQPR